MNDTAEIPYFREVTRKLVHLSSLWMPLAMCFLNRRFLVALFGGCLILNLIVEHLYADGAYPRLQKVYDFFFRGMLRKKPVKGQWIISGGPYVWASAFLSILIFPNTLAACTMTTMLLGDTAAALTGRKLGRIRTVNGKSLEGTLAFMVAGYAGCALMLFLNGAPSIFYLFALPAVTGGALAELFEKQLHLDDNFSIPIVTGCILALGFL